MNDFLAKMGRYLMELVFPEECMHCKTKTSVENNIAICFNCELQLEQAWDNDRKIQHLKSRFKGLIDIQDIIAQYYFVKNGVSQTIIHEAKYQGQTKILEHYATVMAKRIESKKLLKDIPDIITPVPNHWIKRYKNGYNQAEVYSSTIAKRIKIKHSNKLLRKRFDKSSQTKRNKLQRLDRLTDLYDLKNCNIKNKHILLVDDVVTSGATIETCVKLLKEGGAKKVSVLAFMFVK